MSVVGFVGGMAKLKYVAIPVGAGAAVNRLIILFAALAKGCTQFRGVVMSVVAFWVR
jgi:hypothetical protein